MLMHIPGTFTSDLLKLIFDLGYGEELLICDGNFPYFTKYKPTVKLNTSNMCRLICDILYFYPLDLTGLRPITIMEIASFKKITDEYVEIFNKTGLSCAIELLPRREFCERACNVAAIVVTTNTVPASNIILRKGIVL